MIAPTTPIGSRTTNELPISCSHSTRSSCSGIEPKSIVGSPAWIAFDSATGMPSSEATSAAISSERSASLAAMPAHASARAVIGVWLHVSNASRAAATALSTSAGVPSGTRPMTSSVAGLTTWIVLSVAGSTHSPPM